MRQTYRVVAALLFGMAGSAFAQGRSVGGTVRDSLTGAPLEGARVTVVGSTTQASTNEAGRFSLTRLAAGDVVLQVRAIGYLRRDVTVGAAATTVDVPLSRDVFKMEEIVITGQATGIARRNLPNAVATVSAEEMGNHPTTSLEHQLQGKVAGADIQTNSGAPGGGVQVRLRGVTSVNATAEPLYVVDGIVMSDIAIPSNQNAITGAAGGSSPSLNQDGQVNRIADLNPADIESIEILKGASAAAIYGGRASNGVVIIRTKRGRVGEPRFSLTQRFGASSLFRKYGSRAWTAADVDATYGPEAAAEYCPGGQCPFYDHEQQLGGESRLAVQTLGSISGGTDATRYFASGGIESSPGVVLNTGFERQSVRFNLDQSFGPKFNLSVNTSIIHSKAQRGFTNNDNFGISYYYVLSVTPSFLDFRQRSDGTYPSNPYYSSNPLATADLASNVEDVWRPLASARLQYTPISSANSTLQLTAVGGMDYFIQKNTIFSPPDLQYEDDDGLPGTSLLSNSDNLNLNLDGSAVHTYAGGGFTATTSVGAQYSRRELDVNRIESRDLVAGQPNVSAGTAVRVREGRSLIKNVGFFAQEELLLMDEKLMLSAGIRADQSSLNADASQLHYYPKLAGSYRFEGGGSSWLDELKVRAAFGQTGNEPLYGQKFTPLNSTLNLGGIAGTVVLGTTGSETLKPEREQEIEAGVDGQFFRSRLSVEASYYRKSVYDLLLTRNLPPSSGFAQEIFNGGKLRTTGFEFAATVIAVQTANSSWQLRTTFATNDSKITELPVPTFQTGGFATSLGVFQIEEGKSATQIVGNYVQSDGSVGTTVVGDANPDFKMAFTTDYTYKRFTVHALLDWQQGGSVINLSRLLYDAFGNSPDVDAAGTRIGTWAGGETATYVESTTFAKLREVAVSYDLPRSATRWLTGGIRSTRLSLSARNLIWFSTPYSGFDPEVSNFGNQAIARNIEVTPYPASRTFYFTIDLGF
jgi:TonB-linked SusC/RagA family outer membrane protein